MQDHLNNDNNMQNRQENNWERNTLREVLLETVKQQRKNNFWRNFWRIIWLILIAGILFSLFKNRDDSENAFLNEKHTAVINLYGEIESSNFNNQAEMLRTALTNAYDNPNVKGIIINANSPGGSPVVSSNAFDQIREIKEAHKDIPLVVVVEDVCASGCYFIASAADKIYANPSSLVGSIGVIGSSFDFTGLMEKTGIKRRVKIAGNNKDMGDPFSPETPEQTKIWQEMLDDIHQEFIKSVKTGRGDKLKWESSPDVFSGRIYTGNEALKIGLIDDFGSIYSVAKDVIEAPILVDYTPKEDFYTILGRQFGAEVKSKLFNATQSIW